MKTKMYVGGGFSCRQCVDVSDPPLMSMNPEDLQLFVGIVVLRPMSDISLLPSSGCTELTLFFYTVAGISSFWMQ